MKHLDFVSGSRNKTWYLGKGRTEIQTESFFEGKFLTRLGKVSALLALLVLLAGLVLIFCSKAHAYTDEQIVNAIFKAEGGAKATYAYGIRSVKYSSVAEARRICFNTIRNNRKRFLKQSKYKDFLEFLASRYCPVGCDNDRGTNKYWIKNVRYFLKEVSNG